MSAEERDRAQRAVGYVSRLCNAMTTARLLPVALVAVDAANNWVILIASDIPVSALPTVEQWLRIWPGGIANPDAIKMEVKVPLPSRGN